MQTHDPAHHDHSASQVRRQAWAYRLLAPAMGVGLVPLIFGLSRTLTFVCAAVCGLLTLTALGLMVPWHALGQPEEYEDEDPTEDDRPPVTDDTDPDAGRGVYPS